MIIRKEIQYAIGFGVLLLIGLILLIVGATTKIDDTTESLKKATSDKKRNLYIAGGILLGIGFLGAAFFLYKSRKSASVQRTQYEMAKQFYDQFEVDNADGLEPLCDEMIAGMSDAKKAEYKVSKENKNGLDYCRTRAADLLGKDFKMMPKKTMMDFAK